MPSKKKVDTTAATTKSRTTSPKKKKENNDNTKNSKNKTAHDNNTISQSPSTITNNNGVTNPKKKSNKKTVVVPPPFELYPTKEQEQQNQSLTFTEGFTSVVNLLRGRKNVLVLAGAGMSVSCGIPDFRSKDSGLYNTLDAEELGLSCPEDLFDYEVFQEDPKPFFQFAKHIYFPLGKDKEMEPSCSHRFLALLQKKGMLLRVYTQNMDGLETVAGVSSNKMVHAHGSLQWATCCKCKRKVPSSVLKPDILNGSVPKCQHPIATTSSASPSSSSISKSRISTKNKKPLLTSPPLTRSSSTSSTASSTTSSSLLSSNNSSTTATRMTTRKRRRPPLASTTEEKEKKKNQSGDNFSPSNICGGILKPGVTFFGEALHDNVRRRLEADREKADALIVIGTSLSVAPMSKVIEYLPPSIPRILINRTLVHPPRTSITSTTSSSSDNEDEEEEEEEEDFREDYVFDAHLLGFCDDVTRALVKELNDDGKNRSSSTNVKEVKRQETTDKESTTSDNNNDDESNANKDGKVLASLKDDDEFYSVQDWTATHIPSERVFLFPGAILSDENATDLEYKEVAHCDGCSQEITYGHKIRKCIQCFDYDLCARCYPKFSKRHFGGKHTFATERS
mmetsp:Transcript_5177/g.7296  ORF Transcript_5177/g.7296 Transcript_5177/m.7296 type:complete len:622 (+) Transcript_5177:52-1917(+)